MDANSKRHINITCWTKILGCCTVLAMSGCLDQSADREGVFVTHWIGCEQKSESEGWTLSGHYDFGWQTISESRYQISFANQLVVPKDTFAFKNCSVYDCNNWKCQNTDGSPVFAIDGRKSLGCSHSSGLTKWCQLQVNLYERITIAWGGIDEAKRMCALHSGYFNALDDLG